MNNTTVAAPGSDPEPTVEQGPPWLADLLVDPPAWLPPLVMGSIVVLAVLVLGGLVAIVRGMDDAERVDLAVEYAELLTIVGTIAIATHVLVSVAGLPYWMDVLGGVTLGFAAAKAVSRVITEERVALAMELGSKD